MCPLCILGSRSHLWGGGGRLLLKLPSPLSVIFQTCHVTPDEMLWGLFEFISSPIYPRYFPPSVAPTHPRSHYHSECYYYLRISVVQPSQGGFGQQSSPQDWTPLWARSNLPRFGLSLFAGFTAPCVFSRGLSPPDDGEDKHVAYRITELWQKKGFCSISQM